MTLRILISNDDGIQAQGIKTLCQAMPSESEVYLVAPSKDQSGKSHSLTLHHPLRAYDFEGKAFSSTVKKAFVVNGTPVDCIKIALTQLLSFQPDWILSGINHGPNLGMDVLYSGTVGAASEGSLHGIKSVAFSLYNYTRRASDFEKITPIVSNFFEYLLKKESDLPDKVLLNVNLPNLSKKEVKGVQIANLCRRMYSDRYEKKTDPRGEDYYWLSGELLSGELETDLNSDLAWLSRGFISITPLSCELTNQESASSFEKTKELFRDFF